MTVTAFALARGLQALAHRATPDGVDVVALFARSIAASAGALHLVATGAHKDRVEELAVANRDVVRCRGVRGENGTIRTRRRGGTVFVLAVFPLPFIGPVGSHPFIGPVRSCPLPIWGSGCLPGLAALEAAIGTLGPIVPG